MKTDLHVDNQYPVTTKTVVTRQTSTVLNIFKVIPFLFLSSNPKNTFAANTMSEESFINSLATMIEAKKVIEPTNKYILKTCNFNFPRK